MGHPDTAEHPLILDPEDADPQNSLDSVNAVTIASCAIQQLPKLLHAMSCMARRSRRQWHKRGVFLGGQWLGTEVERKRGHLNLQRKGILKNNNELGLDQLSAYNDFWKVYSFSFRCPTYYRCIFRSRSLHQNKCPAQPIFSGTLCIRNLQGFHYKSQTKIFLESLPPHLSRVSFLKNVHFRQLSNARLTASERNILPQLHYLKLLFNTPLHKLVRERPKEFLLPLPRRHFRRSSSLGGTQRPYYARSLTNYQTVATLPKSHPETGFKWLSITSIASKHSLLELPNGHSHYSPGHPGRTTTASPKGVEFITYPDSVDETSFEGTIGGRNLISWKEGTVFPRMGIDQTPSFKYKKEMGKLHMIQSRLRAARIYRRIYCDHWNNYVNGKKVGSHANCPMCSPNSNAFRLKSGHKRLLGGVNGVSSNNLLKSWFKLEQLKKSLRAIQSTLGKNDSDTGNSPESADTVIQNRRRKKTRKAARNAERRRRLKMVFMTFLKYISCGLVPYLMKGECRIFKKRLRTADSTERCPTPPLPLTTTTENLDLGASTIIKS